MNRTHKPDYYELLSELKELTNQHELLLVAHRKVCSTCLETLAENEELSQFLQESVLENCELIMDLSEAREDRKILAKQLRDERSFSSQLIEALVQRNDCPELELDEDPDQYAARHGLF